MQKDPEFEEAQAEKGAGADRERSSGDPLGVPPKYLASTADFAPGEGKNHWRKQAEPPLVLTQSW